MGLARPTIPPAAQLRLEQAMTRNKDGVSTKQSKLDQFAMSSAQNTHDVPVDALDGNAGPRCETNMIPTASDILQPIRDTRLAL